MKQLPERPVDADRIRERLAVLVEEINGCTDAAERVRLYRQIEGLRADLLQAELDAMEAA